MQLKKEMKRLLVVEDDEILSNFLDKFLLKNEYQASCIHDGDEIPKLFETQRFDAVVLDLMLPNRSGMYWLKWMRQYHSYLPVIIISSKVGENDRLQGLKAGARDYVVKPFHEAELLIRLENILQKSPRHNRQFSVDLGNIRLELHKNRIFKNGVEIKLTVIEVNILKLLYINAGATLSRDEISEQIRGTKYQALDRSIDIHINRLRKKMEDEPSKPVFIQTVRSKGYSFRLPETAF